MSYQVLARKWRPQAFDEVSGQEHVTTPLRNAIRSDRVPHALLLAGPRGVGKTTLARLLARCLNCDKGPTDTPCGSCSPCSEITRGSSTDVQEIDAASRTSVDDVRELIEAVRYAPSPGKHRIYVVDEVHMLSTPAFNALLKTLEEPPPQTLFVFCTTNPEKIPFTVLSRCQRYDLRRLTAAEIVRHLGDIARSEGVTIGESSLRAIAREGDGSMRDAMTLLDQIIAMGGGEVDDEQVAQVLDLVDRRLLLRIVGALVRGEAETALAALGDAAQQGIEARRLGGELLQLLRDLVVLRAAPGAEGLVEGSDEELRELGELAASADASRLRRMFRALLAEQEDLAWAPQPFAVLEMAAVRLATLPAGDDVAGLLERLDALERRLRGEGPGSPGGGSGGPAPERKGSGSAGSPEGRRPRAPRRSAPAEAPQAAPPEADAASAPAASAPADAQTPDTPAGNLASAPPEVVFDRLRARVQERERGTAAALEGGRILARDGERIQLQVPQRFAATRLESRRPLLEEVIAEFFGTRLRLVVEHGELAGAGESDRNASEEEARRRRQAALEHPGVNAAMDVLGAEIVQIGPVGRPTPR